MSSVNSNTLARTKQKTEQKKIEALDSAKGYDGQLVIGKYKCLRQS